ncbi:hypothetical protein NW754_016578 [Fusarium falciforme]|nr:hypothetical protein NW754_016578 [Fusarium falciforme]
MAKTAFITGANSGVGLAATKLFLSKGWNVAATARDTSSPALQALDKGSGSLLVQYLDLSKAQTFGPAIAGATGKFGQIDVLVNNAGYGQYGVLEQLDIDAIRDNFEVNVFGTMGLIKEFIPHMRATSQVESPSRIIYVGSGGGHFGLPLIGPYGASKAAMNIFMESLVYEMEGVNPPYPGEAGLSTWRHQRDQLWADVDADGRIGQDDARDQGEIRRLCREDAPAVRGHAGPEHGGVGGGHDDLDGGYGGFDKAEILCWASRRGENLERRMQGGEAGEDADEVDKRYMDGMRGTFL